MPSANDHAAVVVQSVSQYVGTNSESKVKLSAEAVVAHWCANLGCIQQALCATCNQVNRRSSGYRVLVNEKLKQPRDVFPCLG